MTDDHSAGTASRTSSRVSSPYSRSAVRDSSNSTRITGMAGSRRSPHTSRQKSAPLRSASPRLVIDAGHDRAGLSPTEAEPCQLAAGLVGVERLSPAHEPVPVIAGRRPALGVHVQVHPAHCEHTSAHLLAQQLNEHATGVADPASVQELCPRLHPKRWQVQARTDANLAVAMTQAVSVPTHSVRGHVELDTANREPAGPTRAFRLLTSCRQASQELRWKYCAARQVESVHARGNLSYVSCRSCRRYLHSCECKSHACHLQVCD